METTASPSIYNAIIVGDLQTDKIKELIKSSPQGLAHKDHDGSNLLHAVAKKGDVEAFRFLVEQGLSPRDVTNLGQTVLHNACGGGNYDMVQYIAEKYPDLIIEVDKAHKTGLYFAAESGNVEILKYLITKGLNPEDLSTSGLNVLLKACWNGQIDMVKYLVKSYPKLVSKTDHIKQSALHWTAQGGNVEIFKYLVAENPDLDPESKTLTGQTVLSQASWSKHFEMVEYLMENYPQLKDIEDNIKQTPLHWTAVAGDEKIFKYLADHNGNVYKRDKDGRTVLHVACLKKKYKMVRFLVKNYPKLLNEKDNDEKTALHTAVQDNNMDVFNYLVDEGLDPYAITKDGKTVLHLACEKGMTDMIDILLTRYPGLKQEVDMDPEKKFLKPGPDSGLASGTPSTKSSENRSRCSTPEMNSLDPATSIAIQSWQTEKHAFPMDQLALQQYIKDKGLSTIQTKTLLQWLCSHVKVCIPGVEDIWPGNETDDPSEIVLVAMSPTEIPNPSKHFDNLKLLFRQKDKVSQEAKEIMLKELESIEAGNQFTIEETSRLQECLRKHSKSLLAKHSNLEMIGASNFISTGYGTDKANIERKTCIVFYVRVKGVRPFNEETFPTELEGFPTDVREGYFFKQTELELLTYQQKLVMGCQICSAYGTCGSLGGFVDLGEGENQKLACLTCWHMFLCPESKADLNRNLLISRQFKREVYQPGCADEANKFGHIIATSYPRGTNEESEVDAALIEITDRQRYPEHGSLGDTNLTTAGFTQDNPIFYHSGKVVRDFSTLPRPCNVVKTGPSTGQTLGLLKFAGATVHIAKQTYEIHPDLEDMYTLINQFEVYPVSGLTEFSQRGDSGSLVFIVISNQGQQEVIALGLLVGGTSQGTYIVTPICAILDAFNLPHKLHPFPPGRATTEMVHASRLERVETEISEMKEKLEVTTKDVSDIKQQMQNNNQEMRGEMTDIKVQMSEMQQNLQQDLQVIGSSIQELAGKK